MSQGNPNDAPTTAELAASFFAAHDKCRGRMQEALSAAQASGFRGFVDVGWFNPPAPLRLGSTISLTIFPVESLDAPLPFGWARYEVTDATKIRVVARGTADA